MDAPQIGPANIASNPMIEPTAIPAVMPFSAAPVETLRINIKIAVRINSRMNDCAVEPAGCVAPSVAFCGNRNAMCRSPRMHPHIDSGRMELLHARRSVGLQKNPN